MGMTAKEAFALALDDVGFAVAEDNSVKKARILARRVASAKSNAAAAGKPFSLSDMTGKSLAQHLEEGCKAKSPENCKYVKAMQKELIGQGMDPKKALQQAIGSHNNAKPGGSVPPPTATHTKPEAIKPVEPASLLKDAEQPKPAEPEKAVSSEEIVEEVKNDPKKIDSVPEGEMLEKPEVVKTAAGDITVKTLAEKAAVEGLQSEADKGNEEAVNKLKELKAISDGRDPHEDKNSDEEEISGIGDEPEERPEEGANKPVGGSEKPEGESPTLEGGNPSRPPEGAPKDVKGLGNRIPIMRLQNGKTVYISKNGYVKLMSLFDRLAQGGFENYDKVVSKWDKIKDPSAARVSLRNGILNFDANPTGEKIPAGLEEISDAINAFDEQMQDALRNRDMKRYADLRKQKLSVIKNFKEEQKIIGGENGRPTAINNGLGTHPGLTDPSLKIPQRMEALEANINELNNMAMKGDLLDLKRAMKNASSDAEFTRARKGLDKLEARVQHELAEQQKIKDGELREAEAKRVQDEAIAKQRRVFDDSPDASDFDDENISPTEKEYNAKLREILEKQWDGKLSHEDAQKQIDTLDNEYNGKDGFVPPSKMPEVDYAEGFDKIPFGSLFKPMTSEEKSAMFGEQAVAAIAEALQGDPVDGKSDKDGKTVYKGGISGIDVLNDAEVTEGETETTVDLPLPSSIKPEQVAKFKQKIESLLGSAVTFQNKVVGKENRVRFKITNNTQNFVSAMEAYQDPEAREAISKAAIPIILGKDNNGKFIVRDLATYRSPHAFIGGATRSGKSVEGHNIITALLTKNKKYCRPFIIDPKGNEFSAYDGIDGVGHAQGMNEIMPAIKALKEEQLRRRALLAKTGCRNIQDYNKKHPDKPLPYVPIVFDEMTQALASKEFGDELTADLKELTRLARDTGMHVIGMSQTMSATAIPTDITSQLGMRVSYRQDTPTKARQMFPGDSDASNLALNLRGNGDGVAQDDQNGNIRFQSPYLDDTKGNEIKNIVGWRKRQDEKNPLNHEKNFKPKETNHKTGNGGFDGSSSSSALGSDGKGFAPSYNLYKNPDGTQAAVKGKDGKYYAIAASEDGKLYYVRDGKQRLCTKGGNPYTVADYKADRAAKLSKDAARPAATKTSAVVKPSASSTASTSVSSPTTTAGSTKPTSVGSSHDGIARSSMSPNEVSNYIAPFRNGIMDRAKELLSARGGKFDYNFEKAILEGLAQSGDVAIKASDVTKVNDAFMKDDFPKVLKKNNLGCFIDNEGNYQIVPQEYMPPNATAKDEALSNSQILRSALFNALTSK